jgi:hypothetical protein
VVVRSTGTADETDLFWHLRVGEYYLHGKALPHPDPLAFTLPDVHWHTTQWLSEALMAGTYDLAGFAGIVAVRLVLVLVLLAALARLLVRRTTGWTGPVVFAATAAPLTSFVQDRPQLPSLVLVVWLAAVLHHFLRHDRLPHRLAFVAVTYLWANLHGLFILAPGLLILLAGMEAVAGGAERRRNARALAATAGLALAVCALTPRGPGLLLAPFTVGAAARDFIQEWAPTSVRFSAAAGFFALLLLMLLATARSARTVPARELAYVLVLGGFGLLAIRNVAPTTILLSPVALAWCDAAWPAPSTIRLPARWFGTLAAALVGVALLAQAGTPAAPHRLEKVTAALSAVPDGTHVLADYNLSGYLVLHDPHVRVAIDGRADRYGRAYIQRYLRAISGLPGWREWVKELHASYAVLPVDAALPDLLVTQLGWKRVLVDSDVVLLKSP